MIWEPYDFGGLEPHIANHPGVMYHLTSKVDFKLNPRKHPANNTTMGGDWPEAGIFLCGDVITWAQGYGYWQPWVVEFDVSSLPSEFSQGGYGGEMFVPATAFDHLRISRVVPLDAYCREEFQDWGWTETEFGTEFDTEQPIPGLEDGYSHPELNNFPQLHPNYRYPGDARQADSGWQDRYKKRVGKYQRQHPGAYV